MNPIKGVGKNRVGGVKNNLFGLNKFSFENNNQIGTFLLTRNVTLFDSNKNLQLYLSQVGNKASKMSIEGRVLPLSEQNGVSERSELTPV